MSRLVPMAAVFYSIVLAAAVLWRHFLVSPLPWIGDPALALKGCLLAAGGAAFFIGLSQSVQQFAWARALSDWFATHLGGVSWPAAFALAVLSGVAEEALFRGAMQSAWGFWPATIVFGLAHMPPQARFLSWTAAALLMGVFFAWVAIWSHSLLPPIFAHFLINFVNLGLIGRNHRRSA